MIEQLEGVGRLESIREPGKIWQVKYRFEITTTHSRKSVGGVGVRVDRKWSEGTVVSVDGTTIPQGEYTLYAQDGESIISTFGLSFRTQPSTWRRVNSWVRPLRKQRFEDWGAQRPPYTVARMVTKAARNGGHKGSQRL